MIIENIEYVRKKKESQLKSLANEDYGRPQFLCTSEIIYTNTTNSTKEKNHNINVPYKHNDKITYHKKKVFKKEIFNKKEIKKLDNNYDNYDNYNNYENSWEIKDRYDYSEYNDIDKSWYSE